MGVRHRRRRLGARVPQGNDGSASLGLGVGACGSLVSRATTEELLRVLRYPKFRLSSRDVQELLGEYLPGRKPWR